MKGAINACCICYYMSKEIAAENGGAVVCTCYIAGDHVAVMESERKVEWLLRREADGRCRNVTSLSTQAS